MSLKATLPRSGIGLPAAPDGAASFAGRLVEVCRQTWASRKPQLGADRPASVLSSVREPEVGHTHDLLETITTPGFSSFHLSVLAYNSVASGVNLAEALRDSSSTPPRR
jgi:hypothetical protein